MLPPREGFSPGASGAVGLMVRRSALAGGRFAVEVLGSRLAAPAFADITYRSVTPGWWPGRKTVRYAAGVVRLLGKTPPKLIEVHNRPEVALAVAAACPQSRVSLFLHNDPQGMRGAVTAADRKNLLGQLASVVCVSRYLEQRLREGVVGAAGRSAVLANCLSPADVPPPSELRAPIVLFAGRVVADKGADSFVAAWAQLRTRHPGWRAVMIGADRFRADSPDTPFLRRLRPAAAAAGVEMTGYRPHDAVLAAMAQAAIVVVPSRWQEPFGLTALEAMACGAALVCAPRGGLPEVAGDAALWVDPEKPDEIAAAIAALAADPDRRAALSAAGLARARLFDCATAARALTALREELHA